MKIARSTLLVSLIGMTAPVAAAQNFVASDAGRIGPATPGAYDLFGHDVAISGEWAVVGAPYDDGGSTDVGAAYVYQKVGSAWVQRQQLGSQSLAAGDLFGNSVAMAGDALVIGAIYRDTVAGGTNAGAAFVFVLDASNTWVELQELNDPNGLAHDWFGTDVAMNSEAILIGSPEDDGAAGNGGAAFVFDRTRAGTPLDPTDDIWSFRQELVPSPAQAGARFGKSVDIDGSTLIVGEPQSDAPLTNSGAAYVFQDNGQAWLQVKKLFPPQGSWGWSFGNSVAVDGDRLVVGAWGATLQFAGQGAAFVYELISGQFQQTAQLVDPSPGASVNFGSSVALHGDRIVIGSYHDSKLGTNAGSAHLFHQSQLGWVWQQPLYSYASEAHEEFGRRVDMDSDSLIVGAWGADLGAADAGATYIYDLALGDFSPFGYGDGSGTPCPCANDSNPLLGAGCKNSTGKGAHLTVSGSDLANADDVSFSATGLIPFAPGLLFTGVNDHSPGVLFGDGLRVVGDFIVRRGVALPNSEGVAHWGPAIGASSTPWAPGQTRFFQAWYRDPISGPCGSGFNLTNGVKVKFH